jgi:hypothetical protein
MTSNIPKKKDEADKTVDLRSYIPDLISVYLSRDPGKVYASYLNLEQTDLSNRMDNKNTHRSSKADEPIVEDKDKYKLGVRALVITAIISTTLSASITYFIVYNMLQN